MRYLTRPEVFHAIQASKEITEAQGSEILEKFAQQQPAFQQMLFGGFAQAIASQNEEMSFVFMDLCFEILCVYQRILGDLPKTILTPQWLQQTMAAMEDEVKSQTQVNEKGQIDLKNKAQVELLEYLGLAIEDAAGASKDKQEAGGVMYNLLFLVTRLFDSVYEQTDVQIH